MSPNIKLYYVVQLAFWCSALIYITFENKRSDFAQMLTHHIATILLVGWSLVWNYWRIGLVVLILHDVGDVFLYSTKASKESTVCRKQVTEALFVTFAVVFFVARLVVYPQVVWVTFRTGFQAYLDPVFGKYDWDRDLVGNKAGNYSMPLLLGLLLCLHVFWFSLIIKIIVRTLKTSLDETGDIRSDSDASPSSSPKASPVSPPPLEPGALGGKKSAPEGARKRLVMEKERRN